MAINIIQSIIHISNCIVVKLLFILFSGKRNWIFSFSLENLWCNINLIVNFPYTTTLIYIPTHQIAASPTTSTLVRITFGGGGEIKQFHLRPEDAHSVIETRVEVSCVVININALLPSAGPTNLRYKPMNYYFTISVNHHKLHLLPVFYYPVEDFFLVVVFFFTK